MIELIVQNGNSIYYPVVEGDIKWETDRKGQPGKLTFSVIYDALLNIQEGNAVRLKVDGDNVFYGFIFKKERDKEKLLNITAYDQLRYLKNKDTMVYSNKTASEVVRMIAQNFNLKTGYIEDTGLKIPSRVEDNKCMVDIIQTALDLTLQTKKQMYVLFDDFGKIALRNVENMKINVLIDKETAENLSYTSSIDNDTYNKIKLSYENKDTGKREIFIAQDSANMNTWGILQYFETIDANVNGKVKADALLSLYNNKKRSLTINGAFGDVRIRAGCSLPVNLDLGDVLVKNFMIVEKVTHTFKESSHFMDLTLRGGVINA